MLVKDAKGGSEEKNNNYLGKVPNIDWSAEETLSRQKGKANFQINKCLLITGGRVKK